MRRQVTQRVEAVAVFRRRRNHFLHPRLRPTHHLRYQVIVSTERAATFTLDEILGSTTELDITEHTTDTHGQTLATFALFDLVGVRLSPRIAKPTRQRMWRPHAGGQYAQMAHRGPDAPLPRQPRSGNARCRTTTDCHARTRPRERSGRQRRRDAHGGLGRHRLHWQRGS